ncbi:MAG: cytochrome C [Candidatus Lindowbacteria bacterium]|nr:cytochrome C [Candidatus Lindowbacteria bacterium]
MNTQKLLTLIAVAFITVSSFGQIAGSAHDFSTENWNNTGQICKVCHTPHNAVTGLQAPLWNHQVTTQTFKMYSASVSPSFNATTTQPDGASKLCLSCHDGVTKVDNFNGRTNGTQTLSGSENLGTDLSNDHPISFTYDTALATADGGLFDPSTTASGLAGGGMITADLLLANKMQCSTCHDVHNGSGIKSSLLVKSNAASKLCLTCHNK